jgi:6-hydroxycyclohex-1-ene-1-carbonyl-CoA dehydrogenase
MESPNEPLALAERELEPADLGDDQVVVCVAGCGVCHTDLGFLYGGVRTRHELPLTLGHEIAGVVTHATGRFADLVGRSVVVPAVTPCGECSACLAGRGAICRRQLFPGNDDHGGFATHVVVPGRGVCEVDTHRLEAAGLELPDLAVVADAATTAYQALLNAQVTADDVVIVVGVGGVGTFGVQLAHAMGARVVAVDVDRERLERIADYGAELTLPASEGSRVIRKAVSNWVKSNGLSRTGWKIFEMSGHPDGQTLAFGLLTFDGHLGVVGYTRDKVTVRLSNLMAFDATARGTWGCLPEHYPAVVDYVLDGKVKLEPFIERRPMSRINETFEALREHAIKRRPVLIPDFD